MFRFNRIDYRYILARAGVPEDDLSACMQWAFGESWETIPMRLLGKKWNERHGDLFVLNGCDSVVEAFSRIGRVYLSRQ
jgi:hypothetical protein